MANTMTNTTVGKPSVSGGIYVAAISDTLTLPSDASTALASDFKCLGYISDDGVSNEMSVEDEFKAWGGDTVYQTKKDTFKATLIEVMNVDVLKTVYGSENVTGTLSTGVTIKANDVAHENMVVVVELMLRGAVKRIVLPKAQVTEVGEVKYSGGDLVGYETTFTANVDAEGNTHYEYIKENA